MVNGQNEVEDVAFHFVFPDVWYASEGGGMPPMEEILEAVRLLPEPAEGATQG